MANNEFTIPIPARLKNVAKGGHVAGAKDIIDDALGKEQSEINQERIDDIAEVKGGSTKSIADISEDIAAETERASGVEAGLRESIDELGQIGLDPDNAISTDGDDFDGDTTAKRSKIPTIGAIIDGNPGVYDVSKRNPTGGPNSDGKFTLEYILANANTLIPTSRKHGGMEICFVHASDNKYVQARCMAQNFTTDVTQWQGVDDEPIAGSKNLVESGGIYNAVRDLRVQVNKNDLEVIGDFYISGKRSNQNRIDGFSFKKGVTYICTHTNDVLGAECKIYDSNGTVICGLTLQGESLSRTNTFTPSSDIENGYVTFGGDNYTLSISASNYLNKEVAELVDNTLSQSGKAADAKITGDKFGENKVEEQRLNLALLGTAVFTGSSIGGTRIERLHFNKGVLYTVTFTSSDSPADCSIKDAGGTTVCGLNVASGTYTRTNTFTPAEELIDAYISLGRSNSYTISISANSLSKEIDDVDAKIDSEAANLLYMCNKKVDISSRNEYKPGATIESTLLNNTGTPVTNVAYAAYTTCDFMLAEAGTTYCTTKGQTLRTVCFYNSNKSTPCLGYANDVNSFTTPAGTAFIRFSAKNEYIDTMSIVKTASPIPYTPYNPIGKYITEKVDREGEFSDNLIDDNAVILENTFMYNNGALLESDSYCTLDFFEVEPNQYYSCSKDCGTFRKVCCFDEDKHFISDGSGFVENIRTFVTPSTCKYVRISLPIAYFNNFMLVKGVTPLPYYPYNPIQDYLNHDTFSYKNIEKIKEFTLKEWSKLQFGMFIHWGVYSAWAGKYDGVDIDGNEVHTTTGTEWMWWTYKLPKSNYKAKVVDFSSEGWNPDAICKMALSVGMKYVVLTIRHHEGFSLIPTQHCEWDVTASSANSDIVMQLKDACDRHGIKFGVYISALLDWNDYGGFGQERWHENVDPYTEKEHVSFASQQADYCRQIVDTYKPYLIWFDGGTYISQPNSVREAFTKKQMAYFPFEITNDRGSMRGYDWLEKEDMPADEPNYIGKLERCNQIMGWGYNESYDTPNILGDTFRDRVWDMIEALGRGFNYLLNVPPKGDGSISENYINWFKKLSAFCRKYTYFSGAKRLFNDCQPNWGRPMYIGSSVFMFILPNSGSNIYVDSIDTGNLKGVHVYNIASPDSTDNYEIISGDRLLIKNVPTSSDDYFIVVRLDFSGPVWCDDYNYVDTSLSTVSIVRVSSKDWPDIWTGIRYNSKRYFIGEDASVSRTRFKYVGETGTKTFNFTIETIGTNSVSVDFIDGTTGTTQTVALTNDSLSNVSLTNGHLYTMNINKTGSGNLRISNIISIE